MERKERKRLRMMGYDYSRPGFYYVTVCTKNREPYFGKIENGMMILNELGSIVEKCWLDIPSHFENVCLDEFVIMPDHVHGIVVIKNDPNIEPTNRGQACLAPIGVGNTEKNEIPPQYQKLPVIIGSFKSAVTNRINQFFDIPGFRWQRSYWCEIVNNEYRLSQIREYIKNNPAEWENNQMYDGESENK